MQASRNKREEGGSPKDNIFKIWEEQAGDGLVNDENTTDDMEIEV
jgi:hypothetical protein